MGFNLGQIIISTLDASDELPIKKRRGWRKPLHSYYKWHGTDVGLGRLTLERHADRTPPRKIYSGMLHDHIIKKWLMLLNLKDR